ncbi:MAG: Unknown protein [uncultured Sulfurovum sp.]|uniref:DUF1643 domain-containing protein n=1 Tax=uncultured Sulfurovum sp. TaxID=269237 RepID=A0A6S6U5K7_9BACT|nr:MAG: Unknown protein [uncultured Sulfurovum sp.]
MQKNAILSEDREYRYILSRIWDKTKPMVMIIGLNPSTADETEDDPTIGRCISFSKSWGYGGVYMLNLFAFRATEPKDMFKALNPVGSENDNFIEIYSKKVDKIICAWGNDGVYKNRSYHIRKKFNNLFYLKMNQTGEPSHPLYLKSDLLPQKWK